MKKIQLFLVILLASCLTVAAQDMRATGKVTFASDGDAVIGATVKVKGTQIVAITDINGGYTITLPASAEKVLEISYTGFKTVSIRIPQSGNYDVQLEEDDLVLGGTEGLVVIGYGSPRRAGTVVGSSTKVESKAFESRPTASAFDALQGKVAGLQIYTSSGQPGSMQSVRLHGVGSINSSTSPLYVLDGVPVLAATILALNPNDIESTTILKDASATSIYGSRAANGVIYVSTKRGVVGQKPSITVSAYMGVASRSNDNFYDHLMGTNELFSFLSETKLDNVEAIKRNLIANRVIDPNSGGFWDTKWIDYTQPHSYVNNADISIKGGTESISYFISASKFHQGGTVPGTSYDRMTVRSNLNAKINNYINAGLNIALAASSQSINDLYNRNYLDGGLLYLVAPYYSPFNYELEEPDTFPVLNYANPHYYANNNKDLTKRYSVESNAFVEIEPIKNLKFKSLVGLELIIGQGKVSRTSSFLNRDNGYYSRSSGKNANLLNTNTIEYAFKVRDKHSITLMAGHEGLRRTADSFALGISGIEDDLILQASAGKADTRSTSSGYTESRLLSFFGRVEYGFDDRIFFDASIRNDKSSRFAKGHNQKTFWSVGAMWNMKNETWLKDVAILNDLRIKASYGTAGNEGIGGTTTLEQDFASRMLMGIGKYGGSTGWILSSPGNPNLTWETQEKLTIGVQASLWSKLSVELEYYRRTTKDLLMDLPLPYTTGYSSYLSNVGGLRNQGVDLELNYTPLSGKDYHLSFTVNFNYNKQEMTKLFEGKDWWYDSKYAMGYSVGDPIGFWLPMYAGVNPDTGAPRWYIPGADPSKTTMDKNNVTADNATFSEDALIQYAGKPLHAPYAGGFGLEGSWKGIGISVFFNYSLGKYTMSNDSFFVENPKQFPGHNASDWVWDYWKKPGDNTQYPDWTKYDRAHFDSNILQNSSFMRLKDVTLSYDFKKEWLKKTGFLEGAQVYIKGRNLWTISHKGFRGIDPEVDANLSMARIINPQEITIGVKLTF